MKQLADWDPVHAREPMLLAATASYIGEGFDCPALDTLFLCSPSSSESIITQNVGRIMRDLPGKTTVEVHDYADTKVPMLTRMHGKRLTAYKRIGFTNPVIGEIPLFPGTEMAAPARQRPIQTRCRIGSRSQGVGEEKRSRRPRPRPPAPRDLGSVPRCASSVTAHSSCRRERHLKSHSGVDACVIGLAERLGLHRSSLLTAGTFR